MRATTHQINACWPPGVACRVASTPPARASAVQNVPAPRLAEIPPRSSIPAAAPCSFHPMIESEGKTEAELEALVHAAIVSKLPPDHLPVAAADEPTATKEVVSASA